MLPTPKNQHPHQQNKRRKQIEHLDDGLNVLHLLNVDHKLSGEVKCRVISRDHPSVFNVYHTSLTVLPLPASDRYESIESLVENSSNKSSVVHDLSAYITKRPDDQTVLVGASIQLDVEYYGIPEPTVLWMRAVSINFFQHKTADSQKQTMLNWFRHQSAT